MSIAKTIRAACAAILAAAAVPAAGQTAPPAAPAPSSNPFQGLWTGWNGVSRDSLAAEAQAARRPEGAAPEAAPTSIPAYSPLDPRRRAEAEALGARVGEVVRLGDCEEGERIARAAGDFALVRAVRDHCRRRDPSAG